MYLFPKHFRNNQNPVDWNISCRNIGYKNPHIHKGSGTATLHQLSPQFINAKPQNKTKI